MRTPFDQLAKQLLREVLAPLGAVETEAEVCAEPQRIDLWFVPRNGVEGFDALGLLGRLVVRPAALEAFHDAPRVDKLRDCVRKHLGHLHLLAERAPEVRPPWMWILSAERTKAGLSTLGCSSAAGFPEGVYRSVPLLRTGFVMLPELETNRSTLLLRLLGRGEVLERAVQDLLALPKDAFEHRVALPILLRLGVGAARETRRTRSQEEFLMSTQDVMEMYGQSFVEWGIERGRREGLEKGLERGLAQGLLATLEARFGSLPSKVRTLVRSAHEEQVLRECYPIAATASSLDEALVGLRAKLRRR